MGRSTKDGLLTQKELKNPIGYAAEGMSDKEIVETLKEKDMLTDDLKMTRRGKEYAINVISKMNRVERLMVERFILEHHGVVVNIEYSG
jgi:hypothetical protein